MKQIISSKGKFNITDSLYESIKKNNPELLMEDDSSFNVFAAYDGTINDIIQKLRLNNNEIDELKKRIKSYEDSVKNAFGIGHSDKAYETCGFYLKNLYKSANGNKDIFLKNLSSEYDPDVIKNYIIKNYKNNDEEISNNNAIEKKKKGYNEITSGDDEDVKALTGVEKRKKDFSNNSSSDDDSSDNPKELSSGEAENKRFINDSDYMKNFKEFEKNYLSDKTINFINELYKKYKLDKINFNDISDEDKNKSEVKKLICIYNVWNKINYILNGKLYAKNFDNIKECLKNNNKIIVEEDNKWSEEEEDIASKEMEEDSFMKDVRKIILGIYDKKDSDLIYEELKEIFAKISTNKRFTDIEPSETIDELKDNEDNLLNYLTNEEWGELNNTLTLPAKGNSGKEKLDYAYKRTKEVINLIDACTFDTRIPGAITNFYNNIISKVKKRTAVRITCNFKAFGQQTPKGFILSEPKERYVDSLKNFGIMYKNISAFDAYRAIPKKEFWKNVAYVDCRTKESLGVITAALGDLSNRNEVNIQQRMISTGLNTNTIIYTLSPSKDNIINEKGEIFDRNGNTLKIKREDGTETAVIYDDLSPDEKNIIKLIKRRYFIIVTEGMFRKGEMLSKLTNKTKNYFGGNNTPKFDTKDMVRIK